MSYGNKYILMTLTAFTFSFACAMEGEKVHDSHNLENVTVGFSALTINSKVPKAEPKSFQSVASVLKTGQRNGLQAQSIFTDEGDMLCLERQIRRAESKKTKTQKNKTASPKDFRRVLEGQGLKAIQE